jgi:tRNA threonylcarbamoyladenosine biosynthesis protein TsaB
VLLLGIETATRRVGVVLASEHGLLGRSEIGGPIDRAPPRHAELLVPVVGSLCAQCQITLDQVSAIAVGTGPGLFTGLRVGVTTAKTMALALRVPMVPLPSLDLLAYDLRHSRALVVAAIDARRGELYYAIYRPVPGGVQRVSEYELGTPEDLAGELEARGEEALLCGDGALRFATAFREVDRIDFAGAAHAAPSLSALAELAVARFEREEFCPPADVLPIYLRKHDAEIAWEGRRA